MKSKYIKDFKDKDHIEGTFMIMKKLAREGKTLVAYIGDKTGDLKAYIAEADENLKVGDVLYLRGNFNPALQISKYKRESKYDLDDFLPCLSKPLEETMREMEKLSQEEFKSEECRRLNDYFFKDEKFVSGFKRGIGGLSQHHNYIGGLAEHTLNVMYLTKAMAYRYDCRFKELAILAAKLHDIGKIEEYNVEGPFSLTLRGEMEGHIVIGVTMLEVAFEVGGDVYSDDFKNRLTGCIVQHHGKLEYGSPKTPNTEEAFIVHYADYIDANLNKIGQVKDTTLPGTWSDYDRRIGTKLYI